LVLEADDQIQNNPGHKRLVRLTLEHGESESSPANSLYVIVTGEAKAKRHKKR